MDHGAHAKRPWSVLCKISAKSRRYSASGLVALLLSFACSGGTRWDKSPGGLGGSTGTPTGSALATGGVASSNSDSDTAGAGPVLGGYGSIGSSATAGSDSAGDTSNRAGTAGTVEIANAVGGMRAASGGNSASAGMKATGGTAVSAITLITGGTESGGAHPLTGSVISTGGTRVTGGASTSGGVASTSVTTTAGGSTSSGGASATGTTTSNSGTSATCAIPRYDSANPPRTLTLSGNLGTHDPVVIASEDTYYLYATGNGIATKTSKNMTTWTATPDVFSSMPSWVAQSISGVTNIWAPDISYFGEQFHLYYAVSTFGSNKSCIGHATRESLSSGTFSDHGSVFCSNTDTTDDWNAIDPNVIVDDATTPWLTFGSFWSGIKLAKLDASGVRADSNLLSIAKNSSIEAPYIVHQCGYYYLFVSFGSCCNSPWDYNIRVGRSTSITGPYVDNAGIPMTNGGGTVLVQGNSTWTAPGHNAVLVTPNATYNIYHALDANHANPTLRVSQLVLDTDGWPVSGGP